MTSTRKCLNYSGISRHIYVSLPMLNGYSFLEARKSLKSVTNEPGEFKL